MKKNIFQFILITILLFFTLFNSYPKNFIQNGPYIPFEVNYKDYQYGTKFIQQNYDPKTLTLISSQPQINIFLGMTYNNIYLLRDNKKANYDKNVEYIDSASNVTRSSLTNVIVIDNYNKFINIINETENIILFIDTDLYGWISPETSKIIDERFKLIKKYQRVNIYKLKNL